MSISDNLIRFAELQGSESDISRFFESETSSELSSVYPVDNEEIHLSIASSISGVGRGKVCIAGVKISAVDDRDEIDVENEAVRDRGDETVELGSLIRNFRVVGKVRILRLTSCASESVARILDARNVDGLAEIHHH